MNLTTVRSQLDFVAGNGGQYYTPTVLVGTIDESGNLKPSENKIIRQTVSGGVIADTNNAALCSAPILFLSKER